MISRFVGYVRDTAVMSGLALAVMLTPAGAGESATEKLGQFHIGLTERYPDVAHISSDDLQTMRTDDVVLFDVRRESEYEVSRLDGAIRVPPSIRASDFLKTYASMIDGKRVVFYCSVGERSSRLADRVMAQAGDAQPAAIYNLEGGIFKWHNEYRDVVAANGQTSAVHPYNRKWGRLLERQDAIRMEPDAQ